MFNMKRRIKEKMTEGWGKERGKIIKIQWEEEDVDGGGEEGASLQA
jgi:hypothetical protein